MNCPILRALAAFALMVVALVLWIGKSESRETRGGSMRCVVGKTIACRVQPRAGAAYDAVFSKMVFRGNTLIFRDGFENGLAHWRK